MFLAPLVALLLTMGGVPAPLMDAAQQSYYAQPVTTTVTVEAAATVAAGATITASREVTATSTITQAGPAPSPVPVTPPQASLRWNPFDWEYLTGRPDPPMGPLAYVAMALILATLGAGAYFYFVKRPQWKKTNSVLHRAANRFALPAIWAGIIGLLFVLFRIVRFDFFDLRLWLYLWLLALVGLIVWFYLWYRNSYPKEMAKFSKVQRAKQYTPGSGKVSVRTSTAAPPPPRSEAAKRLPGTSPAQGTQGARGTGTQAGPAEGSEKPRPGQVADKARRKRR